MHSKKHGRSKSRKPVAGAQEIAKPETSPKQIEELIVSYTKQGVPPAMIGEILKKEHSVPYLKITIGKRMGAVLKEAGLQGDIPADMLDLMKKAVRLNSHLAKNRQDVSNRIRLGRTEAKIWRLTKYYISRGRLPNAWRYDIKSAELLIKGK
ncbi:MAG: 30S ribosomal protein S15 [Candidatus Micrarchaeota archaeon]|nr:30S ribosomal protein S15 [Candidatus Micrarchaeota archaeon]